MDLDGTHQNPTCRRLRSINLDCGNHVGRERLTSVTSRHSGVCGLELEPFVTYRSTANFNLSQNKSLHKRERRPRLPAPETDFLFLIERTDDG